MILKTAPILGKEGMNSALLIKGWLRSVVGLKLQLVLVLVFSH